MQASNLGAAKAAMPFWKIVMLGIVAGLYIGLCAALLMTVGPNCPGIASANPGLAKYITGAVGFPFVLLMILVRVPVKNITAHRASPLAAAAAVQLCS